jgi:peptidoglycan/LPS O-acetylase OafA/YrhL
MLAAGRPVKPGGWRLSPARTGNGLHLADLAAICAIVIGSQAAIATPPSQRLDHVHGLRGIAALAVVFQHACQMVREGGHTVFDPLLDTINLGRFGVVLFFLISGLVIPFSFKGARPLRNFVVSRLFRLYPAYWLSIPVLSWVAAVKGYPPGFATILGNLTMMQGFWGGWNIGPGYWTLNYEMGFYVLCALLVALRLLGDPRVIGALVLVALVLALLPFASGLGTIREMPFFIGIFLLGTLLRAAFADGSIAARRWALLLVPLAMATGIVLGGAFVPVPNNANVYFKPLALASSMSLPIAVFVAVLWLKPRPGRVAMYLGTISYSLYLFQDIGLHVLPHVLSPRDWPMTYMAAVFALTLVVAALVYRFVEAPMIAIGRRLAHPAPAGPGKAAAG